ncbi:MAG: 1-aminocyclopropane-1-carboxylate deaminase/D-cysteine desulfhydrase [Chitinispirillaceae bacterium]
MLSLFKTFPRLEEKLPHLNLGNFPTPVTHLDKLSSRTGKDIYLKRDDISGEMYGGNKIRKLEFILGEAKASGAGRVITVGGAGSNHALATAIYASQIDFSTTLMLFDQPNAESVKDNLLADLATGAEMILDPTYESHCKSLRKKVEHYTRQEGTPPFVIPAGGSSVMGTIGFVNAGFELAEQIKSEKLPEFSTIYLALGTMGTAAGLLLGMRAAGLRCRLHAVRVVPTVVANENSLEKLFRSTIKLLRREEPAFPAVDYDRKDITFDDSHFGEGYGIFTPESMNACKTARESENVSLDGTYTGKAFAALLESKAESGKSILFWNTKNSRPLETAPDYRKLPPAFHHYFEEKIQD